MTELFKINRFPEGVIIPPPSKSLSHRALICAALSGSFRPGNLGCSEDVEATEIAIRLILSDNPETRIVDCRESGSTLRFLIPVAGLSDREWSFRGSGRLMDRPQDIYEGIFKAAGAGFIKDSDTIRVCGPLRPGRFEIAGNVSSQFVSGLLIALPLLDGDSEIFLSEPLESIGYVDMTLDVMEAYGVTAEVLKDKDGNTSCYRIRGRQHYVPCEYVIEPDYSQAAFFFCAAALGRNVSVRGLREESMQGDRKILDILSDMGTQIIQHRVFERNTNPNNSKGTFVSGGGILETRLVLPEGGLAGIEIDAGNIPDIIPPLAALACFCNGTTEIRNAGRLRMKESDRISALYQELLKLGANITENQDGLTIIGGRSLSGGAVDAHGDHRIAMALAVAAIGCTGDVLLTGSDSVKKSYPNFWEDFCKTERQKERMSI